PQELEHVLHIHGPFHTLGTNLWTKSNLVVSWVHDRDREHPRGEDSPLQVARAGREGRDDRDRSRGEAGGRAGAAEAAGRGRLRWPQRLDRVRRGHVLGGGRRGGCRDVQRRDLPGMILLDTQVLLWVVTGARQMGRRATDAIDRADGVLASAISYVELAVKGQRRKLVVPGDLPLLVHDQGIQPLAFTEAHTAGLAALPALPGHDPFDRMLLAQAQIEGHSFATADSVLLPIDPP